MRKFENPKDNPEVIEAIVAELVKHVSVDFKNVFPPDLDIERLCREFISRERAEEQLDLLEEVVPGNLRGKKLLEIGSGCGPLVNWASTKYGALAYGIEASEDEFSFNLDLASLYFSYFGKAPAICNAVGESLPFADNTFDVVFSSNVLEHVQDAGAVLSESVRVLKPGGTAYIAVPNYGSWWEGHYGILWIPHLPRFAARWYVRLFKRSPDYIDTLQFITVGKLNRYLAPLRDRIEILSWGMELWEKRLTTLEFAEWAALGRLKRITRLLGKLKIVSLIINIGRWLNWQTPIVLVFRKK